MYLKKVKKKLTYILSFVYLLFYMCFYCFVIVIKLLVNHKLTFQSIRITQINNQACQESTFNLNIIDKMYTLTNTHRNFALNEFCSFPHTPTSLYFILISLPVSVFISRSFPPSSSFTPSFSHYHRFFSLSLLLLQTYLIKNWGSNLESQLL